MTAIDLETEFDVSRPSAQRVTIASTVDMDTGRLRQYDEASIFDLVTLVMQETHLIGYNLVNFDLRVLSEYAGQSLTGLPSAFDLYRDLAQRAGRTDISLDELAKGTLGMALQQHGGDLATLGQLRQLRDASANGAHEIAAIYRYGARNQLVRWLDDKTGRLYEIPVQWN